MGISRVCVKASHKHGLYCFCSGGAASTSLFLGPSDGGGGGGRGEREEVGGAHLTGKASGGGGEGRGPANHMEQRLDIIEPHVALLCVPNFEWVTLREDRLDIIERRSGLKVIADVSPLSA